MIKMTERQGVSAKVSRSIVNYVAWDLCPYNAVFLSFWPSQWSIDAISGFSLRNVFDVPKAISKL